MYRGLGIKRLGNTVKRGALYSSSLQVLSIAIDIAVMAVMARLLTPSDYGIFAAGLLVIAVCDLMREVGVGVTIIQLPQLTVSDQRTGLSLAVLLAAIVFLLVQAGAEYFAAFMKMPELEDVVRVLAFMVLIQSVSMISQGMLLRNLKVVQVTATELIARSSSAVCVGISLALAGFGYWALVAASLVEVLLTSVVLTIMARPSLMPQLDRVSLKRLLGRGSGFALSRILNFISLKADMTIVGRYEDAAGLGIYTRATKLMNMPTTLYTKVADRVVFPAMAKVQDEPERLQSAFLRGLELTALIGMPLAALLSILAPELIHVLMGQQWLGVIPVFAILAFGTYFRLAARVSGSLLRATASIRQLVITQFIYAALTVVGCLYAVEFGVVAVAWVVAVVIGFWFVLMTFFACRVASVSLRKLLTTQVHGVMLAALVAVVVLAATLSLRNLNAPAMATLVANGIAMAALAAILVWLKPSRLLGPEGTELLDQIGRAVSKKINKRSSL